MKCKLSKQKFIIAVLIVSMLLSLSFLTFQNIRVEATISVVDYITGIYSAFAVRLQKQHKLFVAEGRYWVWYASGTNAGFKTSTDGNSWSSFTSIGACGAAAYFDVYYNGTKICYARGRFGYYVLYYRSGIPNSDGTITWDTTEQTVLTTSDKDLADPSIRLDSSGYPYISYLVALIPASKSYVIKSDYNNGTWHTASGYPMLIDRAWYMAAVLTLSSNKMYLLYAVAYSGKTPSVMYGRLYNGSGWESEVQVTTSTVATDYYQEYDAIADLNGNVHVQFIKASTHELKYCFWNYTTQTWSGEEQVYSDLGDSVAACLSQHNSVIYSFWQGYPTASHIYYKKRVGGVWDSSAIDWIADSDGMPNKRNLLSSFISYSGEILVVWLGKTSSPYAVKFTYLTLEGDTEAPTFSNLGTNTTIAGQPCKFYVKWTDDYGLSGYIFGTNNTGSWINETWSSLTGNPAWSNVTKTLNSTVGVKIAYRFWCNDTSDNWADTGLTFLTTSSEDVTIEIYESWISDSRLDYGSQVTIKFRHRYNTNQTPCETGTSYVNGTSCSINSTGWIIYTKTYSAIVKYSFTISQVNVKGYTTFQMVTSDAEVIWDRLEVESCGTGDNRANINSSVVYWWKLRYDYDNIAFTNAKGSCNIGGTPATWSSYNSRWELNILLPSTPQSYSRSLTFTDSTYSLTVITGTTSQSVIADRMNINSFVIYDNRINVGATASFGVSGIYEYDSSVWSGTYSLNQSTSKSSVGKYWYSIQSVTDSTYGLTVFQQSASNVYVIFDKLTVTFSANDTSPDVGETVTISWTIIRQYDSSGVTSFTIDISRDGILWQTLTNNSKNDVAYADVTRIYTLYPTTVTDNTYDLTAAQANSVTVVWGIPIVPGEGFNLYFETNGKLAFQHLDVTWETQGATITLTVTSGTLNGSSGTLIMYSTGGTLTFINHGTSTILLSSTGTTFFTINGEQKNSTALLDGYEYVIAWSINEPVFLLPLTFILGMIGLGSMFAGPIYGIYQVKHGEYYEGFRTGLVITAIGAALCIAWLWI